MSTKKEHAEKKQPVKCTFQEFVKKRDVLEEGKKKKKMGAGFLNAQISMP